MRKHKCAAENDAVIEAFDRNMRKMQKRCQRAMEADTNQSQSGWSIYGTYCDWLEQARKSRDEYLSGKRSAEDALKVICVE